jgi:hypothetical protein
MRAVVLPADRRHRLHELGLRALIKRRFGDEVAAGARPLRFGGGAAVLAGGHDGAPLAAVFADRSAALGTAIDLADREGAGHLYFFAEENTGGTARRAAQFRMPITVVDPDGDFEPLDPAPPEPCEPLPSSLKGAAARLSAAGLDVVWEHGDLTGEWLGLEVARAVEDAPVVVEVGVGRHDREANRLLHPDGTPDAVLDQAVAMVRDLRRPDAPPHPANLLAPDRWLRAVLARRPDLIGMEAVHSAPPPEPRQDLRARSVAPAWAVDADGSPVVVVSSVGVDPDLVPQAADARSQAAGWPDFPPPTGEELPSARLITVVPEGDDHPLTRRLLGLLRHPGELVTVPRDWRRLAP